MPDDATQTPGLIALDWGTSSLRAWLLDATGAVLDSRSGPWGIMQVPRGGFAVRFTAVTAEWRARWPGLPAIAAGMVGSAQGWVEVPYCPLPAGPRELASRLERIRDADLAVVPGLVQNGLVQDGGAVAPDVMRGEETQVVGALTRHPALQAHARLIMPGTHSKWVDVTDGRVVRFTTWMTGEVFAVLRHHSILGRLAPEDAPAAEAAFLQGVDAARDAAAGVTSRLFSARALVLTGRLQAGESLEYLSGLLIGDEIKGALQDQAADDGVKDAKLTLIGDAALCRRYHQALVRFGAPAPDILDNTAPWGLWRIAAAAGLLPAGSG